MFKSKLLYLVVFIFVIFILLWQMTSSKVPEPNYKVIKKDGQIEIRQYPPLIIAQVEIQGERYPAINAGFKILANYIFGNNQIKQKIPMTAPVIQQGMPIPMSAPVSQQKSGAVWQVRFVMPSESTLNTLPQPINKTIKLLSIPKKKYVVICFSGMNTQSNLDSHEKELMHYITKYKLKQLNTSIYAFYDPPWILPFLRRNEIMIEIE